MGVKGGGKVEKCSFVAWYGKRKWKGGRDVCLEQGVLTGFVGREEMMLSIDSRRSGYISARRTSRSVGDGG